MATQKNEMTHRADEVREVARERYAAAASLAAEGKFREAREVEASGCSIDSGSACGPEFGAMLYEADDTEGANEAAVMASLGCGVPTAVADLEVGETVLDMGSGSGADVLISARRVGPTGKAIGIDMTEEMLALARSNAAEAGAENVEFLKGHIEELPLADGSVDVVISNCVINLAADKGQVIHEAARVLRAGGRFAVSDIIRDEDLDAGELDAMRAEGVAVAGAMTRSQYESTLAASGLGDLEVRETHRIHEHGAAAIIRARKRG